MSVKVLLVTGIFPPDLGGPATFNFKFAQWASQNHYEIKVLTYFDFKEQKIDLPLISIVRVNRNLNIFMRYLKMIQKIIWHGFQSDVILANGCFIELSISRIFFIRPLITKIPGDPLWERARNNGATNLGIRDYQLLKQNVLQRILRNLTSKSMIASRFVITPSRELAIIVTSWGIKSESIKVIPNGVDLKFFHPHRTAQIDFDVVTMARLVPWKGIRELIKVCAELNLSLAVIGDGPEKQSLIALSDQSGAKVKFFGSLSQNEAMKIMSTSKIFVLNSEYEGFPHALVEAMALELICVARAHTGCEEIILDATNGYLVDPTLPHKSLPTILGQISEGKIGDGTGTRARVFVLEHFSFERTFESIGTLISRSVQK